MNGKKVLSLDKARSGETRWLPCCWDDCERTGTTLYQTRFHDHSPHVSCETPWVKHVWYVFCSERHKQLFLNGHHEYGKLASGTGRGL